VKLTEVCPARAATSLGFAPAAAYQGDPITSRALLNEAGSTAHRLGADANHAFTAFGPTNVGVHRVSAAVTLGDGGTVLQHAKVNRPGFTGGLVA
jgi:hypothetical protein